MLALLLLCASPAASTDTQIVRLGVEALTTEDDVLDLAWTPEGEARALVSRRGDARDGRFLSDGSLELTSSGDLLVTRSGSAPVEIGSSSSATEILGVVEGPDPTQLQVILRTTAADAVIVRTREGAAAHVESLSTDERCLLAAGAVRPGASGFVLVSCERFGARPLPASFRVEWLSAGDEAARTIAELAFDDAYRGESPARASLDAVASDGDLRVALGFPDVLDGRVHIERFARRPDGSLGHDEGASKTLVENTLGLTPAGYGDRVVWSDDLVIATSPGDFGGVVARSSEVGASERWHVQREVGQSFRRCAVSRDTAAGRPLLVEVVDVDCRLEAVLAIDVEAGEVLRRFEADATVHDFEVLVLGTLHAPFLFRHPDYSPAHVEAVLHKADPDVIGVESNPTWFERGEFYPVTYEAQGVAVPFALERGIPLYGIDWMSIESWDERVQERIERERSDIAARLAVGPLPWSAFGRLDAAATPAFDAFLRDPDVGFARMNGLDGDLAESKFHPPGDPTRPGWGGERNRRIYEACLAAMRRHPGERLVVVIGGGHKPVLDALFARTEGVRLMQFGDDVAPPTDEELDAAWTPQHVAATLGHNLDGERTYLTPGVVDLDRMARLVDRLAEMDRQRPIATYYRGRIAYEDGRFDDAMRQWDALGETFGQWDPYPFPMDHWRMRYGWSPAIRIERARTLMALGRREEALGVLDGLAERLPKPPALVSSEEVTDALTDADFEDGTIVRGMGGGWRHDDVLAGTQRSQLDDDAFEGEHSLRIDVLHGRDIGSSALVQSIALDESIRRRGEFTFTVQLRAKGIDEVRLVAYRWDDTLPGMATISESRVTVDADTWAKGELLVPIPDGIGTVHLFMYYAGIEGAQVWFDDAHTFPVPNVTTPEEWTPRTLAREFVRRIASER